MAWLRVTQSIFTLGRAGCGSQCFPFYVYDEDGTQPAGEHHRLGLEALPRALRQQEDHQVGHLLLRLRHAAPSGLPRAVCREPQARAAADPAGPGLPAFAAAGKELARLHLDYEKLEPWPLEWIESPDVPLSYRVDDKMRLSKDKTVAQGERLAHAGRHPARGRSTTAWATAAPWNGSSTSTA